MFVDGGEVAQWVNGEKTKRPSNGANATLSIPLTRSWKPADVKITEIDKPVMGMVKEAIFTHEASNSFYIWGGHVPYDAAPVPTNQLWRFSSDGDGGGTWNPETPGNPSTYTSLTRSQGGAYVSTPDAAFWFGGLETPGTSGGPRGYVPGYLSFNFTTKSWANETNSPWSSYGTLYGGDAHYVPTFGPNGIVILIGGSTWDMTGSGSMGYLDMQNLTFFDPVTREWHSQTTSGEAPLRREWFCVAGAESTNGTYEIVVHGGRNQANKAAFDDVYILSLPGFVWTKAEYEAKGSRTAHACVVACNRQMISIGGVDDTKGSPAIWEDIDPRPQGLGIFDMTQLKWTDAFDADAGAYESPAEVQAWYDEGGLQNVQWSSDNVQKLFTNSTSSEESSEEGTSGGNGNGNSGNANGESSNSSTPVGAIAGGVVGGVAGIALVAFLVWFLARRRRRNANQGPEREKESHVMLPAEMPPSTHDGTATMTTSSSSPSNWGSTVAGSPAKGNAVPAHVEMDDTSPRPELMGSGPYPYHGAELDGGSYPAR
ncbi:Kelch repeat-containing protein like [Verticillium longisporum]|nr:Kelch repeat-containing protein like [Verticillium longisporum]